MDLQAKVFELNRYQRVAKIDEEIKMSEESIGKQFTQAVARAEDADRRLTEKLKEYDMLKV